MIRDASFDLLKAIAIFMVVLWHAISDFSDRTQFVLTVNFIIGVNMPLFFVISGYFAVGMIIRGDKLKLLNRLIGYWWPVTVFSVIAAIYNCFAVDEIPVAGIPLKALKMFLFGAWFFYALSICDVVTFAAYRVAAKKWACSCVAFAALFVLPAFWYKGPALNMLPFFLFGAFILPKVLQMSHRALVGVSVIGAALYLSAVLFVGDFWARGLTLYSNYLEIYHFDVGSLARFAIRLGLGVSGSIALIGLVRGLLAVFPTLGRLAPIGEQTMGVYFIHRYGLAALTGCAFFTHSLLGFCVLALIVFLLCSLVVALSKKDRILAKVIWGPRIKL